MLKIRADRIRCTRGLGTVTTMPVRSVPRTGIGISSNQSAQSFSMVLPALAPEVRSWISVISMTGTQAGTLVPFS